MERKKKIVIGLSILCVILFGVILFLLLFFQKQDAEQSAIDDRETGSYVADIEGKIDTCEDAYHVIRPSIVKIDMGEHTGSGVILSIDKDRILIVSSGHLLQYYESGVVTFSTGGVTIGWVKGIAEQYDVGLMECYTSDIPADRLALLCSAPYDLQAYEALAEGNAIFQVGSASGVASDYYEGNLAAKDWYFEEFGEEMMYLYCKATPGMSGGGTFSEQGYLMGLISGSYLEESCSVPLPDLLDAVNTIVTSY